MDFKHIPGLQRRFVRRAGFSTAWRDAFLHIDNPVVFVQPKKIQRDEAVLHPDAVNPVQGVDEQHAAAFRQVLSKLQAFDLFIACDGHFRHYDLAGRELDGDQGGGFSGNARSRTCPEDDQRPQYPPKPHAGHHKRVNLCCQLLLSDIVAC